MKTDYQLTVIGRLKALRESRNLSQAAVARLLGISPGQLGNIESYKRSHKYTLRQIYTLSQHFGIELEQLIPTDKAYATEGGVNSIIESIIKYQDD